MAQPLTGVNPSDYFASVGNYKSERRAITYGVAQGSILSPVLFYISILPLAHILENNKMSYYKYADDRHIYIMLNPNDNGVILSLNKCI